MSKRARLQRALPGVNQGIQPRPAGVAADVWWPVVARSEVKCFNRNALLSMRGAGDTGRPHPAAQGPSALVLQHEKSAEPVPQLPQQKNQRGDEG